ncbi:hypothetical protein L218DRAFT_948984 [Marasmius fiardii PR-910]|nr:hypothetical protein L218DRAFT_948984 [Marasmius fiardii PR-910]
MTTKNLWKRWGSSGEQRPEVASLGITTLNLTVEIIVRGHLLHHRPMVMIVNPTTLDLGAEIINSAALPGTLEEDTVVMVITAVEWVEMGPPMMTVHLVEMITHKEMSLIMIDYRIPLWIQLSMRKGNEKEEFTYDPTPQSEEEVLRSAFRNFEDLITFHLLGEPNKANTNVQKTIIQSIRKLEFYYGDNDFVKFDMFLRTLVRWMNIAGLCGPEVNPGKDGYSLQ